MIHSKKLILFFAATVIFLFIPSSVKADLGPKPTVDIYVFENGLPRTDPLLKVKMLGCKRQFDQKTFQFYGDCEWNESTLFWFRGCIAGKCSFTYMLPDKFKIAYQSTSLSKEIISNEIDRVGMNSKYNLFILGDKAKLERVTTISGIATGSFVFAFLLNLLIEAGILYLFIKKYKLPKNLYVALLIGNLITLPLVWIGTTLFNIYILFLEIFAVLIEFIVYYYWARNLGLESRKIFSLALLQNVASVLLGGLISALLSFL